MCERKRCAANIFPPGTLRIHLLKHGWALTTVGIVAFVFGLSFSQKFLIPVIFSIFIAYTLNPFEPAGVCWTGNNGLVFGIFFVTVRRYVTNTVPVGTVTGTDTGAASNGSQAQQSITVNNMNLSYRSQGWYMNALSTF